MFTTFPELVEKYERYITLFNKEKRKRIQSLIQYLSSPDGDTGYLEELRELIEEEITKKRYCGYATSYLKSVFADNVIKIKNLKNENNEIEAEIIRREAEEKSNAFFNSIKK